jgi:photosystem II PsbZ protein
MNGEVTMTFVFQLAVLGLIFTSFVLVIGVPVVFASTDGWSNYKTPIFSLGGLWFILVFAVGILNSFVV